MLKIAEGDRRQILTEVIPDLGVYRAQLINTHDLPPDICDTIDRRVAGHAGVIRELVYANGQLAYYTEPSEHGPIPDDVRVARVTKAVEHLHVAVESLAYFHDVPDVEAVHLRRMQSLLGADAVALEA